METTARPDRPDTPARRRRRGGLDLPERGGPTAVDAGTRTWTALLAACVALVAAVDLVFFALIREVIPPLAVGAVLTGVGLALLRRSRRWGIGILAGTSVLMLAGSIPFAVDHLGHPESGIDFTHSVVGVLGRVVAIAAAIGAWRGAPVVVGRRLATVSVGALAVTVALAAVATIATSGEGAEPGDVVAPVERAEFPEVVEVSQGGVVYVDNRDLFRHTFTVVGTDIDVEIPARQGVRVPVDAAPGTYELICEVPGHESMTATLTVR